LIRFDRLLNIVAVFTLLAANVLMAATFYFVYLYENPAIEYYNLPAPTDKQVYRAGDTIKVSLDLCRYTSAPGRVYIELVDGVAFTIPASDRPGLRGCRIEDRLVYTVENNVPPGTYFINAQNDIRVLPWVTRSYEWTSQRFRIER